jgi:hypothetical protein
MTTPSSTSQSVFWLFLGMGTQSSGSATVLGGFMKTTGALGGSEPDSAAWAA